MKQENARLLADGATTFAVSTGANSYFGWFVFVSEHTAVIGLFLSFIFGTVGLVFYWLTWKKSILADDNKKELLEQSEKLDQHIVETRDEFHSITEQVNEVSSLSREILNKLDKG